MTSKEIHILREINENHAADFERCEDITERTIRLNTLNSIMNDIIDLIILGSVPFRTSEYERREDDTN